MKNNHIFQKQNQSGRSMVEILGVIAIIGVLSIGGIIGYSYGMDKYRANQTIHDITLRGTDIIAPAQTPVIPRLSQAVKPVLVPNPSWMRLLLPSMAYHKHGIYLQHLSVGGMLWPSAPAPV